MPCNFRWSLNTGSGAASSSSAPAQFFDREGRPRGPICGLAAALARTRLALQWPVRRVNSLIAIHGLAAALIFSAGAASTPAVPVGECVWALEPDALLAEADEQLASLGLEPHLVRKQVFLPSEIRDESDHSEFRTSSARRYVDVMSKLQSEIASRVERFGQARRVFYPMSGWDAIFARDFTVATDNHPFFPAEFIDQRPSALPFREVKGEGYIYYGDISNEMFLGARVIGTLRSSVPGFRLRSVTVFRVDRSAFRNLQEDGTHGLIVYDTGEGTPLRHYVQVHAEVSRGSEPPARTPWWIRYLDAHPPEIAIVKGAMSRFEPDFPSSVHWLRDRMVGWLQQTQGHLIEGFGIGLAAGAGEFSGSPERRAQLPVKTHQKFRAQFGYGGHAGVIGF